MRRKAAVTFFLVLATLFARGQQATSEALFVANEGQWTGDFRYKADLSNGAMFFTSTGYTCVLRQKKDSKNHDHHHHAKEGDFSAMAYEMEWLGTDIEPDKIKGREELAFTHNYFLGRDSSRWKANVGVHRMLRYQDVYNNVDVEYKSLNGELKYDVILHPGADISEVKMKFNGVEDVVLRENRLVVKTALGEVSEWIPFSYQMIDGQKVPVQCHYILEDEVVGFTLGPHSPSHPVVIDPILEFSTFTGSTSNNWGFTATYGHDGSFYGGGIVFGEDFPATFGVYQPDFNGSIDITINKFSADGSQLEYATFVGGANMEAPHSMIVNQQGQLLVLGNTGSDDFPTTSNAFQKDFVYGESIDTDVALYRSGSNIVLFKLDTDGTSLLSSTLLGGSTGEGINKEIAMNYGDNGRGEVIVLDNGNVAITSSALSSDLPLTSVGAVPTDSTQKAILAVFNPALSNMIWGTYFGGSANEAGYSIKTDGTRIYMSGATTSSDLQTGSNAIEDAHSGLTDGFLAHFDAANGQFIRGTYIGTPQEDEAFFVEVDKYGDIYTYGQSQGNMPITPGHYSNPGSFQFVQKYNNDLTSRHWSTQVGSGESKTDLVPTAFMVDQCLNIYLSGWGGHSNTSQNPGVTLLGGNTDNLPVTGDAFQSTTDGSDFYFMVLNGDAQNLLFASYFGGTSREHVDGGTSRFDPNGIIYQAACAACYVGTFPTTPQAYAPTKPSTNCNLGAVKIDFQQIVRSRPEIDFNVDVDTVCNELHVQFTNNSIRANKYYWDFGNGHTSLQEEPNTVYENFGTYEILLVAEDTVCGITDSSIISVEHTAGAKPKASFEADYLGCDKSYQVQFTNTTATADLFEWDFGDGDKSTRENPTHSYADTGTYEVRFIARDSMCLTYDTVYTEVSFGDTTSSPDVELFHPHCGKGELDVILTENRQRYSYRWEYPGGIAHGPNPYIKFNKEGYYPVSVTIKDPLCDKEYKDEFEIRIDKLGRDTYIPNAFSPNGDGLNEEFLLTGDDCLDNSLLRIFNRWGEIVFKTEDPYNNHWDGTNKGKPVPSGVYTYILQSGETVKKGHITLFR